MGSCQFETVAVLARIGNVLYWLGCILATLMLAFSVLDWLSTDRPIDHIEFLRFSLAALLIWLIGRACRYVLSGN